MRHALWMDLPLGLVCVGLSIATMILNSQSRVALSLQQGERITGLLIGSDFEDNARHSDTMMVVSYNPQNRMLDVLSIPRDTMVQIPGLPKVKRVNETFTYEYKRSGKSFSSASLALKSVVESILSSGTARAFEIPYYFTIDYSGFRALIDAMGGIYIKVIEPMHYDDNWGHLHIHFDPGIYHLDGKRALEYVRFRGKSADQGRVLRQQLFVKEVLKRFKNPLLLFDLPHYSKVLLRGVHTSFSSWDLISLSLEGRKVKWNNIRLMSLPGVPFGNLWRSNPMQTQYIVSLLRDEKVLGQRRKVYTVDIWNGTGRSNMARVVTQMLRQGGFDVVSFGTYPHQNRTLVIDRTGNLSCAQAVAQVLKAVNPEIVSRVDPGRQVDVSVVIGADFPTEEGNKMPW